MRNPPRHCFKVNIYYRLCQFSLIVNFVVYHVCDVVAYRSTDFSPVDFEIFTFETSGIPGIAMRRDFGAYFTTIEFIYTYTHARIYHASGALNLHERVRFVSGPRVRARPVVKFAEHRGAARARGQQHRRHTRALTRA